MHPGCRQGMLMSQACGQRRQEGLQRAAVGVWGGGLCLPRGKETPGRAEGTQIMATFSQALLMSQLLFKELIHISSFKHPTNKIFLFAPFYREGN